MGLLVPEKKGFGCLHEASGQGSEARWRRWAKWSRKRGGLGNGSCEVDNYATTVAVTELRDGGDREAAADRAAGWSSAGAQSRVCASGM